MRPSKIGSSNHTHLLDQVTLDIVDLIDTAESAYASARRELMRTLDNIQNAHSNIYNARAFDPASPDYDKCYHVSIGIACDIKRAREQLSSLEAALDTCAALYLAADKGARPQLVLHNDTTDLTE